MSLNQTPESHNSTSRRSLLPATLLAALSLALSACNKSETPVIEEVKAPGVLPTGTMPDTIPTGSTQDSRKAALSQMVRAFIQSHDVGASLEAFPHDPAKPHNWRLAGLTIGFGPDQRGTHMVTIRQQGDEVSVYDMVDYDSDGSPDRVEYSVSSPILASDGTHMMRSEKSYVVDQATHDMFAAGLNQATHVLGVQKEPSEAGNK